MGRVIPAHTSYKYLSFGFRDAQETLLGTPETLPTSEPVTPQISYTVASGDLPFFSMSVHQVIYIAYIYGAGKFVTAGTVYYRIKKNGVSVSTGSLSVSANMFYTFSSFFMDVAVNDVLELALWSNQTDSNWDYKAYNILPTRLIMMDRPRFLTYFRLDAIETHPVLYLGNPSACLTDNIWFYNNDVQSNAIGMAVTYNYLYIGNTYGLYRPARGDYYGTNFASGYTHATYRPYYVRNRFPLNIAYRGYRLD